MTERTRVDFTARIEAVEAMQEDVHARIETCRQAMLLSRLAIGGGLAVLAAVLTVAPRYATAITVFSAFTAILGGIVWLGANKSSKDELDAKRAEVDTARERLFDEIAAQNGWAAEAAAHTVH